MSGIVFGLFVVLAGFSGALFQPGEWYDRLRKPSWNPPKWVFPVVWTILYVFIAVAGWLIWRTEGIGFALIVWCIQLVLNASWSWLFFGLRRMDWAFWDVSGLLASIILFVVLAWPVSMYAAILFFPYIIWVCVAALLNWTVWSLNPNAVSA